MSRIPWLWNIDSRLKQVFVFFRPPEVVNFRQKSLLETTFSQSKQICSFDDGDTHTRSIDLVGVESTHSAIEVKDSQMKPETPNASHATPHFWCEMRMENHQARQVDLSRLCRSRSAASRPNNARSASQVASLVNKLNSALFNNCLVELRNTLFLYRAHYLN